MKYLKILIFLLVSNYCDAQIFLRTDSIIGDSYYPQLQRLNSGHATKEYKDSTGIYTIQYDYNTKSAMMPLVEGAQLHYSAIISVYKNSVLLKDNINGTYVEDGCFEDDSKHWVDVAKNSP